MREIRIRSLRTNAYAVVLAVVGFPIVFVLVSNGIEAIFGGRTLNRAIGTATELMEPVRAGAPADLSLDDRVEAMGRARDQRIRIVDTSGAILASSDHVVGRTTLFFQLGDLFYGPNRAEGIAALENRAGPLVDRPEFSSALAEGFDDGCEHSALGNLILCHSARRAEIGGRVVVIHVQGSSRRALQALYESRRQLAKLTGFVLFMGFGLAWWMARRMVRPVESLRAEVLARASAAVPKADLHVYRADEVGDLASAFNTLLGALADRSRANEAFLADLAHEFKNPVAAIRACSESLEGENAALDGVRARRIADVLKTSSRRLDALVTQFLELARAEAGLPDEDREPVDLGALLRGLADSTSADPRFKDVSIDVANDLDPDTSQGSVLGVPHRLESAFRNLLDNGASFAGAGGSVEVKLAQAGDSVEVTVTDSGPGIAAADLPRVFERFYTTRGEREGTGLGLALTRAVVEAHGGSIRAESPPGQGARFVVRLPRV